MFIDTSGLLCCFDADEARHRAAIQFYDASRSRLTHNYVLAEFVALAQARQYPRELSLNLIAEIQADATIEIVWVDRALHNTALSLLQSQLDKSYSLCDAVSFVLMRERGISDALTTDRHFEQAGFRRLLPS
jgi:predicted nucleic acid-binding protein